MGNGADTSAFSKGVGGKLGGRNSPTVWNAAFHSVQFWDGRAALLEDQAKGPLINPVEMAMRDHAQVVERVASKPEYVEKIKKIYGEPVSIDNIAKSIAAFERTLLTPDSPFDQYMKGNKKALSASAVRGMKAVQSVGCTSCHSGPNFAGPMLPMGTGFYQKFPVMPNTIYDQKYGFSKDLGRFEVTKQESDKNMWRVPSWRNVARTAPYFHNGSVATLEEAVRVMAKTQLNRDLSDAEVKDMVAFLTSLNGKLPKITEPKLPM
jgi:cytochrome c peroxidase